VLRELAADLEHPDPDHAARTLILLHDGAFQVAALAGAVAVRETLRRAVDELFPRRAPDGRRVGPSGYGRQPGARRSSRAARQRHADSAR
jgi:hypothetical protein